MITLLFFFLFIFLFKVDENWKVKVADFGLSSVKSLDEDGNRVTGAVGSPFYMAPEVLVDKEYDDKADVYSFSIIVWEVLTNEEPYKDEFENYDELVEAITLDNQRPGIPNWFTPSLRDLVQSCWDDSPTNRPSFEEILSKQLIDHATIDFILREQHANAFWKAEFIDRVTFSPFISIHFHSGH
jgi:serine/threonine protein kinase